MSRARFLKRNHGTEIPSNLAFFDTESNEPIKDKTGRKRVLSLRLWTLITSRYDGKRESSVKKTRGHTCQEFWDSLFSRVQKKKPLWCFAHNLNFDLTMLGFWPLLENGTFLHRCGPKDGTPHGQNRKGVFKGSLCIESRPMFLFLMTEFGPIRFVDTGNYWPTKLESIGHKLGVPKMDMPKWDAPESDWFEYCENDSRILQVAVVDLLGRWKKEDCGVFKPTAPGLAMQNFRHTCKVKAKGGEAINLEMDPKNESIPLERRSYYGGRIEPFYIGKKQGLFYHLDVNSLYPRVMRDELFPCRRHKVLHNPQIKQVSELMSGYGIIADVKLVSSHETFPYRHQGQLYHVVGDFSTTLAGPELRRAIKTGSVERIIHATAYFMAPLFKDWVDTWFERKVKAQQLGDQGAGEVELCKLVLNSLSGKWAQKGEYWKTLDYQPARPDWGQWAEFDAFRGILRRYRNVAGIAQEYVSGNEPHHSFPAISAFITSHAREFMRNIFKICPRRSIYYTATDSIICNRTAFEIIQKANLIDDTALGKLKIKGIHGELEIFGPNHYRLDDMVTRSGSWARCKPMPGGGWFYESWQNVGGTIAQRPNGTITIQDIEIVNTFPLRKGVHNQDGWVDPFWMGHNDVLTERKYRTGQLA